MKIAIPSQLSDADLVSAVIRLARRERDVTAHLVAHLAELDARRLYLGAGFSSLFAYCREVLELSESESYNRIEAARAARKFPVILDLLGEGSVNLTTVRLLAPHLTGENHRELLAAGSRKSKREVEELLARHAPRPEVPFSVRKLPAARSNPAPTVPTVTISDVAPPLKPDMTPPAQVATLPQVAAGASPIRRPAVTPLAADRYEIRFTASAAVCEKLRLAKELLRHAVPAGDTAEIVDRALTLLLEDLARKKCAATPRPRPSRGAAGGSRHVPAKVRRAVWLRDGGRCAFVGSGAVGAGAKADRRCGERGFLEFHHLKPYGVGGEATVTNIQLRCRAHNAYESDLFYGLSTGGEGVARESRAPYGPHPKQSTRSGASWRRDWTRGMARPPL